MKVGDVRKWSTSEETDYDLFIVTKIEDEYVYYKYLKVDFSSHWGIGRMEKESAPATKLELYLLGLENG